MIEKKTFCREVLKSAAAAFRLGKEGEASKNLVRFIDSFLPNLPGCNPEYIEQINELLNEILAAQSRKDYLRVADLLEYEVFLLIKG